MKLLGWASAPKHPELPQLALLAGGDLSRVSGFLVRRHVDSCAKCRGQLEEFAGLRLELGAPEPADADWARLEREMRANIRLGLEAGACVRPAVQVQHSQPGLAVAFASLCLLALAGYLLKSQPVQKDQHPPVPVLAATGSGLELRSGQNSMMLLNRHGAKADHTVGAQGEIRARFVDTETGSVTINNVYLEN